MESKKESRRRYSNWLPIAIAAPFLLLVVLLAPSDPANAALGSRSSATSSMIDDDGPPSAFFSSSTYTYHEGAGSALITVYLSVPSGITVTIDFATSDGTATAGEDYESVSDTLVFNPGQAARTFSVPINDDLRYEPTETVTLWLSSLTSAVLGPLYSATLYILNDDGPAAFFFIPFLFRSYDPGEHNDGCSDSYLPIRTNTSYWFLPDDPFAGYRFDTVGPADIVVELTNFVPEEGMVLVYYSEGTTCPPVDFIFVGGTIETSTTKILDLGRRPAGRYFVVVTTDGPLSSTESYWLTVHVEE